MDLTNTTLSLKTESDCVYDLLFILKQPIHENVVFCGLAESGL